MQALILAGGKGTRLRPLTVYTPKPIVPICNRPFLLYQIDTLRRAGVTDITLSLSYQPEKIEQQLGDGSNFGVKLKYTVRSEEHTSELQSRLHLVCRLLLEKKTIRRFTHIASIRKNCQ